MWKVLETVGALALFLISVDSLSRITIQYDTNLRNNHCFRNMEGFFPLGLIIWYMILAEFLILNLPCISGINAIWS